MSRCCVCRLELPENGLFITCTECKFRFHFGECSGVTEELLGSRRDGARKNWKCDTCKGGNNKNETAVENSRYEKELCMRMYAIETKLDSLLSLPGKVQSIEESVQVISDKFDQFQTRLLAQEKSTKELEKRVGILENSSLKEVDQLRLDVDNLEWRSRRLNIEIHGIQETENENLIEKVNSIADKICQPHITKDEVTAVHRLAAKPGKTRGIIIRFARQEQRDSWLANKKELKKESGNVYICENMTRLSRELLFTTKDWARSAGYAFVWHTNGKVLVRKKNGERAVVIRSVRDLEDLK